MRIGLFTDTYFPQVSGVATSIRTLKTELEKQGHAVFIFTTTDKDVNRYERLGKFIQAFQVFFFAFRIAALPIEVSARHWKLLNSISWISFILRQNFLLACWGFGLRVN